jgi:hypothetical protein
MIKTVLRLTMAASLLTLASVNNAGAQTELNNRTKMTFAQPVEVPGKILPAGTYTFEMHDSGMNRHVIEIFDEGGTKLQALVLAIPSYRPKPTEDTVVKFDETAPGQPQAIRIWYYPGQTTGNELVYSKSRARELAAAANTSVQSTDDTMYTDAKLDTLKSAEVTAIEPEKKADQNTAQTQTPPTQPVTTPTTTPQTTTPQTQPTTPPEPTTPQTTPQPTTPVTTPQPEPQMTQPAPTSTPATTPSPDRDELPHTASTLPMLFLIGGALLLLGVVLRAVSNRKVTH